MKGLAFIVKCRCDGQLFGYLINHNHQPCSVTPGVKAFFISGQLMKVKDVDGNIKEEQEVAEHSTMLRLGEEDDYIDKGKVMQLTRFEHSEEIVNHNKRVESSTDWGSMVYGKTSILSVNQFGDRFGRLQVLMLRYLILIRMCVRS